MSNINRLINIPYWSDKTLEILSAPGGDRITLIHLNDENQFCLNVATTLFKYGAESFKLIMNSNNGPSEMDTNSKKDLLNQLKEKIEVHLLYLIHKTIMMTPNSGVMFLPINLEGFSKYSFQEQVKMAKVSPSYLMDRNLDVLIEQGQIVRSSYLKT